MSKLVALALLATFTILPMSLRAQGSLTPPGAPGSTMKSLDQIEARTPITSAPFTITNPGSYYLTTNLNVSFGNAIFIATNAVTVDLNGFTISSSAPGATGVGISSLGSDCTILNGHVTGGVTNNGSGVYSGPGFGYGIYATTIANVHVTGVTVSGCLNDGINVGNNFSSVVESCAVYNVGGFGIVANTVSHCAAYTCGNTAINADTATDCYGYCAGSTGNGIGVNYVANNCNGVSVGGDGVYVFGVANNCSGLSSTGNGIHIGQGMANTCWGRSTQGNGIYVQEGGVNNCYGYSGFACGIDAEATSTTFGGMVNNSFGRSASGTGFGTGIYAHFLANNSVGICESWGYGINVDGSAVGSVGYCYLNTGPDMLGLNCFLGVGSFGYSSNGNASASFNYQYDGVQNISP